MPPRRSRESVHYRNGHRGGKTHVTARLLPLLRASGIRCAGMKPICYGGRDAEMLLAAGSDGLTIDDVNPVLLKTPRCANRR